MRVARMVVLAAFTAGCGGADPPPQPQMGAVVVRDRAFAPTRVEVPSGAEITWANHDPLAHTVTSGTPGAPDGLFDEALDAQGSAASVTLDAPGRYPYFCALHPGMTGEVVVTPS